MRPGEQCLLLGICGATQCFFLEASMNWGRLLAGTLVAASFALPASVSAAPLFPDVPDNHWAVDAVKSLAARGIIEGYPDGTFKGDRAATRWEVAMVVARLLAKMEQEHATFATRAELAETQKLVDALRSELDALGVRTSKLERDVALLDTRVTELERINFYGTVRTIAVSNVVKGDAADIGTVNNRAVDWSTGRVISDGSGLTMYGLLGVNATITDDIKVGAEFIAFSSMGDESVNSFWGVSAPFSCNSWTQRNGPMAAAQGADNRPFTRMVLDNFWITHEGSGTKLTAGSFYNRYVGDYLYNGAYNPSFTAPDWFPMYGFNLRGSIGDPALGIRYEGFYSVDPDASLYNTNSYGGALRYEFPDERGAVGLNVVKHGNDRIHDGSIVGEGIPLPTLQYYGTTAPTYSPNAWLSTPAAGGPRVEQMFVGAQSETTLGIDATYTIDKELGIVIDGEFACSNYDPDTTGLRFNDRATGNMYKFGISASPIEGLSLALDYRRVDPTYDPFIVQYPQTTGIPVFSPFGGYYSAYYQMHDYVNLPNNRQGFGIGADYRFNSGKTSVSVSYKSLQQVKATTAEQAATVGNIEPIFAIMVGDEEAKGHVNSMGIGLSHSFDCSLKANASYYRYDLERNASAENDMGLGQNVYALSLTYPITDKLDITGGYTYMDYTGHIGLVDADITQSTPGIALDYRMSDDTLLSLDYRFLDFKDRINAGCDYQANQLMLEMRVDF